MSERSNWAAPRTLSTLLCGAILFVVLAACATADTTLWADAFAGAVDDDLFIGVLVAGHPPDHTQRTVIVYLCDGADVATWFFEDTTSDSVVLEAGDTRVELSLGEDAVTGEVELAGAAAQAFTAELATVDGGLFRAVKTVEGQDYVGGWIVLSDLRQRGAITLGGVVIENPTLDVGSGEAETSLGTFGTNCFINPHTGERICRYLN
jgi:hypothetical protein